MSISDDIDESAKLADEIRKHDKLYWETAEPEISDEEYDLLVRRLSELDPSNSTLNELSSPSMPGAAKVRHARPMLSLDKVYTLNELIEWVSKSIRTPDEPLLVQPKYDGVSVNFDGKVLATRGDGVDGEDVSSKIPLVELEAPGRPPGKLDISARGELVIRNDDFKKIYSRIRRKGGEAYKNSRNAVGGILGLLDISDLAAQGAKITLVDYALHSWRIPASKLANEWLGILETVKSLPYPMDGIVVKLADEAYSDSLGCTAHHPRGQIAFKFYGFRKKTRLLGVEWGFGKERLTPVAKLAPVEIEGVTIKQATLHNIQRIIDMDIQAGDIVTVERAGDVIPHIVSRELGENRHPCLPTACPCCASLLLRDGPDIKCANESCSETLLVRLLASVKAIGIKRLGEPNLRKMVGMLGVKTLSDIFDLKLEDILKLDGFKGKSAANLIFEINSARNADPADIIAALNICGIGKTLARKILDLTSIAALRVMSEECLATFEGVGTERASAIHAALADKSVEINALLSRLIPSTLCAAPEPDSPKRFTICFTGKMPYPRSFYEELARSKGLEPVNYVTSSLDILVAGDNIINSLKMKKAENARVKVMRLAEWLSSTDNVKPSKTFNDSHTLLL